MYVRVVKRLNDVHDVLNLQRSMQFVNMKLKMFNFVHDCSTVLTTKLHMNYA